MGLLEEVLSSAGVGGVQTVASVPEVVVESSKATWNPCHSNASSTPRLGLSQPLDMAQERRR